MFFKNTFNIKILLKKLDRSLPKFIKSLSKKWKMIYSIFFRQTFYMFAIIRITTPYRHPNNLTKFIIGQLRNRVLFHKAIKKNKKKSIELTKQTY